MTALTACKLSFRKLQRNFQDYGAGIATKKVLLHLFKPFGYFTVCRIYGIALSNFDVPEKIGRGFCFKLIDSADSQTIRQIEQIEDWLHGRLKKKLERGGLCLVAMDGQRVAGFNLIAFGETYIPPIQQKRFLRESEAWSEQISVHRDYRSQQLAIDIRHRIFLELKKRKIEKLFGSTRLDNHAAMKLAHKLGFTMIENVAFLKVLSFKTWRHKKLCDSNLLHDANHEHETVQPAE